MLFIFTILAAFLAVIHYQTFNAVKAGRTLVGFQNNLACSYLNIGRKIGFTTYRIIMVVLDVLILIAALDAEAWASVAIIVAFIFTEVRSQQLLRQTKFVATDIKGNVVDNGPYLTPATVPQAAAASPVGESIS